MKHGWLQSHYVDFNVEASREPLSCQSLSLKSMVQPTVMLKCRAYYKDLELKGDNVRSNTVLVWHDHP